MCSHHPHCDSPPSPNAPQLPASPAIPLGCAAVRNGEVGAVRALPAPHGLRQGHGTWWRGGGGVTCAASLPPPPHPPPPHHPPSARQITENPGFTLSDGCGGRRMGDVTSIWVLEVLEIYRHSANTSRLVSAWPAVVRAVQWSIAMSVSQGLPTHLVCTCASRGAGRHLPPKRPTRAAPSPHAPHPHPTPRRHPRRLSMLFHQ